MESGGQSKIPPSDSSLKDKSNLNDNNIALEASAKSKAGRGPIYRKLAKKRLKSNVELEQSTDMKRLKSSPIQMALDASGEDNKYCLDVPPTPLHPQLPMMKSIGTPNTPLSEQSSLHISKFQLQLFPIDEPTRKCMEAENHCPYLELTITAKKKIASIIRHLNMKWGNSANELKELILFPYNARLETLKSCKRWTVKNSNTTAAEVHACIGKPALFRLRYGWVNAHEQKVNLDNQLTSPKIQSKNVNAEAAKPNAGENHGEQLWKQDVGETAASKAIQTLNKPTTGYDAKFSWVDCVSNMSFGALFSQAEATEAKACPQGPPKQVSISCDSFDAAIAAHIARYQPGGQSTAMAQPSILDAEETCNPFSFRNFASSAKNQSGIAFSASSSQSVECHGIELCHKPSPPVEPVQDNCSVPQPIQEDALLAVHSEGNKQAEEDMQADTNAAKNVDNQFEGIDLHWQSSTGSWQFMVSSSQQMIGNDSNGLNEFVSTTLNIF